MKFIGLLYQQMNGRDVVCCGVVRHKSMMAGRARVSKILVKSLPVKKGDASVVAAKLRSSGHTAISDKRLPASRDDDVVQRIPDSVI